MLIFSDASVKCYAAAVYLQCITGNSNSSKTNLVFAKTCLVPVNKRKNKCKKWTIPRLELLAVLIRVRAANFVAAKLKVPIIERILWTDSQCVLHWLKTRKPLPIFVENRVKEIKSQKNLSFCYIASVQNPSDCATRGLSVTEIHDSTMWWHGPEWLSKERSVWPIWNLPELTSEMLERIEMKESHIMMEVNTKQQDDTGVFLFRMKNVFSSLRKLLRVSVYVL